MRGHSHSARPLRKPTTARRVHKLKAKLHLSNGQWDEAKRSLEIAEKIVPYDTWVTFKVGPVCVHGIDVVVVLVVLCCVLIASRVHTARADQRGARGHRSCKALLWQHAGHLEVAVRGECVGRVRCAMGRKHDCAPLQSGDRVGTKCGLYVSEPQRSTAFASIGRRCTQDTYAKSSMCETYHELNQAALDAHMSRRHGPSYDALSAALKGDAGGKPAYM